MASNEDITEPLPGLMLTSGNVADRKLPVALAQLSSLADNEINLWLLLRQLKTRVGVVPFVGAGMSVPFGFPAWRPFLESQAPEAGVRQHVVNLLDQGLYEEAAETLLKAQGESAFQAALEHAFGEHQLPNPLPAAAILQLPRLCSGPVLTTNFDPVLEKVFENARRPFEERILGMNVKALRGAFDQSRRVLVKLHGDAADQSTRVLTRGDYERAYGDQEPLKAVLRFAVQARPLLFLGCGLRDDRTVRVLEALAGELRKQKAGDLLAHYAVVEWPANDAEFAARHERLKQLGIFPIWYPTGKHHLIADLLTYMAAGAGRDLVCGQVPKEPLHYLLREERLSELRASLLSTNSATIALTGQGGAVGVQGMGGVGKTVLAAALTRDSAVQRTFPDGIFWLTVGQQPKLLAVINQLAGWLPDCGGSFISEPEAQSAIRQALAGKRALLILDDVWYLDHAAGLNLVSAPSRLLVTTRKREVLVGLGAQEFCVDVLSPPEALRMLADWAGVKDPALLPPQATDVAEACGCLPLALAMIGAMVQLRPTAWPDALEFLRSRDLEEFRRAFPDYPYPDLLRAIAVSVDELPPDDRERYLDLAVFPEDEPIPEGPLQVLWGLTPAKTRACMDRLAARSLATVQQAGGKTALLLHDLQGDYIRKSREKMMRRLHETLLNGYAALCELQGQGANPAGDCLWASGPNDGYFFQRLAWHLKVAGRRAELKRVLGSFRWLRSKLEAVDVIALMGDYDHLSDDLEAQLLRRTLLLSSRALVRDKNQLAGQLVGRLSDMTTPDISALLECAKTHLLTPWICPMTRSLNSPKGALLNSVRFGNGHAAVGFLGDVPYAVVNAEDRSLAIWNVATGQKLHTLLDTTDYCTSISVSPDNRRALTASSQGTLERYSEFNSTMNGTQYADLMGRPHKLCIWEVSSGALLYTCWIPCGLTAHAFASANDRVLLACGGFTISIVDYGPGGLSHIQSGLDYVSSASITPDGRWCALANRDQSEMWDLVRQVRMGRYSAPSRTSISHVAITPDGHRAVIFREDKVIFWEITTSKITRQLDARGQETFITSAPDGWHGISSASFHAWFWDFKNEKLVCPLDGHFGVITSAMATSDGKTAITASYDNSLKKWDLQTGKAVDSLDAQAGNIFQIAISNDNSRFLTYQWQVVKLWNFETDAGKHRPLGHESVVEALSVSRDGRHGLTGSFSGTVKCWDLKNGTLEADFDGSNGKVNQSIDAVALSPDGAFGVSASCLAGTLHLWDLRKRALSDTIKSAVKLPDGIRVSQDADKVFELSKDGTIRFWKVADGKFQLAGSAEAHQRIFSAMDPSGKTAILAPDYEGLKKQLPLEVWNLEKLEVTLSLEDSVLEFGKKNEIIVTQRGHRALVRREVSETLASTSSLQLYDLASGKRLWSVDGSFTFLRPGMITSDGNHAAISNKSHELGIWDLRLGLCQDAWGVQRGWFLCWSPSEIAQS